MKGREHSAETRKKISDSKKGVPSGKRGLRIKQFCSSGHDTSVVGRTTSGGCTECHSMGVLKHHSSPEHKKRATEYSQTPERKAASKAYLQSVKGKEYGLKVRCKRVGITVEHYHTLPKRCSLPHCAATKPGRAGDWLLDHDHSTGKFRGLLCHNHNAMLGHAHDNVEELRDGVEYLQAQSTSDPYFSTVRGVERLMEQYRLHKTLIVAMDYDDTIFDYHKKGYSYPKVIKLLLECQKLGFTLIMLSTKEDPEELRENVSHCAELGLRIKYINEGPIMPKAKKPFFNIYLDDKAGLAQAYDILNQTVQLIRRPGNYRSA